MSQLEPHRPSRQGSAGRPARSQPPVDGRRLAALRRDQALRRLTRMRTGAIGAAAGLIALFAGLVADVAPGRSSTTHSRPGGRGAQTRTASPSALPPLASPRQLGLRPTGAPQATGTTTGQAPTATGQAPTTTGQAPTTTSQTATGQAPTTTSPAPATTAPAPAPAPVVSGGS